MQEEKLKNGIMMRFMDEGFLLSNAIETMSDSSLYISHWTQYSTIKTVLKIQFKKRCLTMIQALITVGGGSNFITAKRR